MCSLVARWLFVNGWSQNDLCRRYVNFEEAGIGTHALVLEALVQILTVLNQGCQLVVFTIQGKVSSESES